MTPPPDPIIRLFDIWKRYPGDGGAGPAALRGVSLEVRPGEVLALLGKSGSGKTTLLNLIAGIDRPTGGRIEVEGRDLERLGESGRTAWRRQRLGFVFQFFNLLPTLTSFENVFLSLELAGRPDRALAEEALRDVGLEGKGRRYPHELSGGEQQRVAIARAIVKQPVLILADEPTGNLDTQTGELVLGLLVDRCRRLSGTLIMASHAGSTRRYADRVLRMVDGAIVEEAPGTDFAA
jgi:putative ABC transport system ATP-binding protein